MASARLNSLRTFAGLEDPFVDLLSLRRRLQRCKSESRYLEWKNHPPLGPGVGLREKYRAVKAALSFANADGGFIVFGISQDGKWRGLTKQEVDEVDPAKLTELINGCVSPELPQINYALLTYRGKYFALLHIPSSPLMPHVTTKQMIERIKGRKPKVIIARHAVYYRTGGRSALASPDQHQKIVKERTEVLRTELLRRIREITVPTAGAAGAQVQGGVLVARLTEDPHAPVMRLTRDRAATTGVLLHEELSKALFDEINNVLEANSLIAGGRPTFLLGEPVYYRVYAERQHVVGEERISLLARTGFHQFYGPHLFWFLALPPTINATLIVQAAQELKAPFVHALIRLVTLLGQETSDWLWAVIHRRWQRHTQRPNYYWSFEKIRENSDTNDSRLLALRSSGRSKVVIPTEDSDPPLRELLDEPEVSAFLLSRSCLRVFEGEKEWRTSSRVLDVAAYGKKIEKRGKEIYEKISRLTEVAGGSTRAT